MAASARMKFASEEVTCSLWQYRADVYDFLWTLRVGSLCTRLRETNSVYVIMPHGNKGRVLVLILVHF